ncbi:MAG: branched-chain amino acid ABC transporter permease [Thermodesulfobacteriota bacterium]
MHFFFYFLMSGVFLGAIYGLIALGIVIIYKSTKVFNFSQGHLLMVAALLGASLSEKFGVIGGMVLTVVGTSLVALVLERLTLRPLIGQPLIAALLMTIALGYLLEGGSLIVWGEGLYKYPALFPAEPLAISGVTIDQQVVWAFVVVSVGFGAFVVFYQKTLLGKAMRATAEDHQASQSMGIRVTRIFSISWIIAGLLAYVASIFLGSMAGAHYLNSHLGLKAIPAVLVGGLDSILGAIVGGLLVGLLQSLVTGYLSSELGEVIPFIVLLVVLLVKPYGLFGMVRIERI